MPSRDKLVVISADTRTNTLIASSSVKSFSILETLLKTLDTDRDQLVRRAPRRPVEGADVAAARAPHRASHAGAHRSLAPRRLASSNPRTPSASSAEPANNLLIVACSDENLKVVKDLIDALTTDAAADRRRRAHRAHPAQQEPRATEVATSLNQLYVQKRERTPRPAAPSASPQRAPQRPRRQRHRVGHQRRSAASSSARDAEVPPSGGQADRASQSANALEVVNLLENVLAGTPVGGSTASAPTGDPPPLPPREQIATEIAGQTGAKPTEAEIDGAIRDQVTHHARPPHQLGHGHRAAPILDPHQRDRQATSTHRAGSARSSGSASRTPTPARWPTCSGPFNLRAAGQRLVLVPTRSSAEPDDAGADPGADDLSEPASTAPRSPRPRPAPGALDHHRRPHQHAHGLRHRGVPRPRREASSSELDGIEANERDPARLPAPLRQGQGRSRKRSQATSRRNPEGATLGPDRPARSPANSSRRSPSSATRRATSSSSRPRPATCRDRQVDRRRTRPPPAPGHDPGPPRRSHPRHRPLSGAMDAKIGPVRRRHVDHDRLHRSARASPSDIGVPNLASPAPISTAHPRLGGPRASSKSSANPQVMAVNNNEKP
jgi:hypothetical protein